MLFVSCERKNNEIDFHQIPQIQETSFSLPENVYEATIWNGQIFYLTKEDTSLYSLELATGESGVFNSSFEYPKCLCAAEDGLYVFDSVSNTISVLNEVGEITAVCNTPKDDMTFSYMDSRDGLLMLSNKQSVLVSQDEGETWETLNLNGVLHQSIGQTAIRDGSTVLIAAVSGNNSEYSNMYSYNIDNGKVTVFPADTYRRITMNGDEICYTTNSNLYTATEEENVSFQIIPRNGIENEVPQKIFVTDKMTAVWWSSGTVVCAPRRTEEESVTLLIPSSCYLQFNDICEAVTSANVRLTKIPDEQYYEKVTTKLLARDSDFDIVFVPTLEEEARHRELTQAILQNHAYEPLNTDERLAGLINEMIPGVSSLMSRNDEIAALPASVDYYALAYTPNGLSADLTKVPFDWTFADLWKMCDELTEASSGMSVFPKEYQAEILERMLYNLIQVNESDSKQVESELRSFLQNCGRYLEHGVLFGDDPVFKREISYPLAYTYYNNSASAEPMTPVLIPAYDEHTPTTTNILSYFIVNAVSEKKSAAKEVLADLISEENRYVYQYTNSPFWYGMEQYRYPAETKVFDSKVARWEEYLDDYYQNVQWNYTVIAESGKEALRSFLEGILSPDETAELILKEWLYSVKG